MSLGGGGEINAGETTDDSGPLIGEKVSARWAGGIMALPCTDNEAAGGRFSAASVRGCFGCRQHSLPHACSLPALMEGVPIPPPKMTAA
jgi:hypothetical protein